MCIALRLTIKSARQGAEGTQIGGHWMGILPCAIEEQGS